MKENKIEYSSINLNFFDIHSVELPKNKLVELRVKYNEEVYFFLVKDTNHSNLLVLSNGAVDKTKILPPIYQRISWHEHLEYSLIYVDDKTLHDNDLKIGWGQGSLEKFGLEVKYEILKEIYKLMGYRTEKIYYYGSSAGGFMSMMFATMHKGSVAIVNNPQTYVLRYFKDPVESMIKEVYKTTDITKIGKYYPNRVSLTSAFKYYNNIPKVFYYQNRRCEFDMKNHFNIFTRNLDKYNLNSMDFMFVLYNGRKGDHAPLKFENTIELLQRHIKGD